MHLQCASAIFIFLLTICDSTRIVLTQTQQDSQADLNKSGDSKWKNLIIDHDEDKFSKPTTILEKIPMDEGDIVATNIKGNESDPEIIFGPYDLIDVRDFIKFRQFLS